MGVIPTSIMDEINTPYLINSRQYNYNDLIIYNVFN